MITFAVRAFASLVALAAVTYVVVAVPVGRRTLYEHAKRIVATEPARELGEDVAHEARAAQSKIAERLRDN